MGWKDDIDNIEYAITTADGKDWFPLFKDPQKSKEYNTTEYDFISLKGTYVDRKLPKARRLPLLFFFTGDDCVDVATDFEKSADLPGSWRLQHPLYGNLTVQPLGLDISNVNYNQTRIQCTVVETITIDLPRQVSTPFEQISSNKKAADLAAEVNFSENATSPQPGAVRAIRSVNELSLAVFQKAASASDDAARIKTLSGELSSAITNIISAPNLLMRQTQALINAPSLFRQTVRARIASLVENFNALRQSVSTKSDRLQKVFFEGAASANVSAIAIAMTVDGQQGYLKRSQVIDSIDTLRAVYYDFLLSLDDLSDDDYNPDHDSMFALWLTVNTTIVSLFDIAFNSKQERSVLLEDDSNIIVLANRFYGLASDDNIEFLKQTNNVGLNEILSIKKGKQIFYYV